MSLELYNERAEQIVLATVLFDADSLHAIGELRADDFVHFFHADVFRYMVAEVQAGRKPTAVSVGHFVSGHNLDGISAQQYLTNLAALRDRQTLREMIALIKGLSARRAMIQIGVGLQEHGALSDSPPRQMCLDAVRALNDVLAMERKPAPAAQFIGEIAEHLVASLDLPDDDSFISTGLRTLDRFIGGWPRGELSMVAGRPSMGKSALLSALARRGARQGKNMMIFSLEMPRKALAARMMSDYAYGAREDQRIPYADILRRRIEPHQKERLKVAARAFGDYPLKIDDQRGLTMPEIHIRALRYADELDKQGKRLDVVMVDHVGKVRSSDRYKGNVTAETTEKSDALMVSAYELDAAVVAACQLNRGPEGREDKHPGPADLRDSGALEQDVNTLLFPYRPAYYLERQKHDDLEKDRIRINALEKKKNLMEILVSKSRNGACGNVDLFVDIASNHVEDLAQEVYGVS
jgi:replicative DNA helicase